LIIRSDELTETTERQVEVSCHILLSTDWVSSCYQSLVSERSTVEKLSV